MSESDCRKIRPVRALDRVAANRDYRLTVMPVFEFHCRKCDARFEELIGSHVGKGEEDVRCPECGAAEVKRQTASGFASLHRQLTPKQKRALEDKRGIDRGGAKQRFKAQRAAERRHHQRGRGG